MTSDQNKKWAKNIMRLLKVDEVIFPICRTSKGNFGLRYGVNTEEYEMYLDAVPLPTKDILNDENNIELKRMVEKYVFSPLVAPLAEIAHYAAAPLASKPVIEEPKKKRGRPTGSKNKK